MNLTGIDVNFAVTRPDASIKVIPIASIFFQYRITNNNYW